MGKIEYSKGNLKKYSSKNPIKKILINRLHSKICILVNFFINENKPLYILDAGCGEGFVSHSLYQEFTEDVKILGVEYTEKAIEIAKKTFPSYSFEQGDITNLSYSDGTFDIVVCSEVFEHLENPSKAFSELFRVSKYGIILTVPHEPFFRLSNFFTLNHVLSLGNPEGHINHWSFRGFKKFVIKQLQESTKILDCQEYVDFFKSFPWMGCIIRK